jgi:hypothetical protein
MPALLSLRGTMQATEFHRIFKMANIKRDVEGLDEDTSEGWDDYPLDAVFVRNENRTVAEVVKRINAGRYQLDPDFQRDFVWDLKKQSRLIESCLMRIPLPVLYVAEVKNGAIAVVDGLQRLTTFSNFLNDKFALMLDVPEESTLHSLRGAKFSDLPLKLQERIEDTQLTLYILDEAAPERAKLDIFERVNNGVPLTRQQMRNCLFNGPATQWLKAAASSPEFLGATGRSLSAKSMRDREAINRFCAFTLLTEEMYRGDMDAFLAKALEKMRDPTVDLGNLLHRFNDSMKVNLELFGEHAFRRSLSGYVEGKHLTRSILNISLFDVCSVLFSERSPLEVMSRKEAVKDAIRMLLKDPYFSNAITYSTNSTRQIQMRFGLARTALSEALS